MSKSYNITIKQEFNKHFLILQIVIFIGKLQKFTFYLKLNEAKKEKLFNV
jgi:hypothetical protein